jgi:hypothetical protein
VGGVCLPSLPFIFPCTNDQSCLPGLNCMPPPSPLPQSPVCTHACSSSDDCAANPALGSNFLCLGNVCVPKTPSGCAPPVPSSDLCLAGKLGADNKCASPPGWFCNAPGQCLSGNCSNSHCM